MTTRNGMNMKRQGSNKEESMFNTKDITHGIVIGKHVALLDFDHK